MEFSGDGLFGKRMLDRLRSFADDQAVHRSEQLQAETDRWIWKAIAQGVGNRVWRSNALTDPWPSTTIRYQFAVLRPGEPAPGAGVVLGPFSKG